jgi:hypothetical protein
MRLSIAQAVGLVSAAAAVSHPRPRGFLPKIDPQLVLTYVSQLHNPPPPLWEEEPDPFWGPPKAPGCTPPEPGALGLVSCAESVQRDCPPRRYGLRGLSQQGRTRLRQAGALMEEQRRCCGFWTITLPDACLWWLGHNDAWPRFQNAIRHRLVRRLQQRGVTPWVAGVVELHPGRSAREGQALPHLHVLYRGRECGRKGWAIRPSEFDDLVRMALAAAGLHWRGALDRCKVEPVRFSVRRYLSKYISKPSRLGTAERIFVGNPVLCPRQWFFISKAIMSVILENIKELPVMFAVFLLERRQENRRGQLYHAQQLALDRPGAPSTWRLTFRSPWALFRCWETYEEAVGWWPVHPVPTQDHDRSLPGHHPVRDQHL